MRPLKPGYDPEAVQKELVDRVCSYFGRVFDDAEREKAKQLRGCRNPDRREEILGHAPDGRRYPSMNETAKEFGMNILKIRKILITGGFYSTEESRTIQKMYADGLIVNQIAEQKNVTPSMVASYIPYRRVIYNLEEKSVNADRIDRYKERHGGYKAVKKAVDNHKKGQD